MNKKLDDKLMKALTKLALHWSAFGAVNGKWDSSAKILDKDLVEHGVKLSRSLYYNYALPENMTHQKFMENIAILGLLKEVDIMHIKDIIRYDDLSALERIKLATYILFKKNESRKKINEYFEFIMHANPELAKLKVEDDNDKYAIVRGAAFGFGPDEMAFWRQKQRGDFTHEQWERNRRLISNFNARLRKLGIKEPQYVLSPKTMQTIMAALPVQPVAKNSNVRTI